METKTDPTSIIGLRLPYLLVEESARTPIIGCIVNPDKGPAIHTNESRDFVIPRDSKYTLT